MTLFSKSIDTKTDHVAQFKKALDEAIEAACKSLTLDQVANELRLRHGHFALMLENRARARRESVTPAAWSQHDPTKQIDVHKQRARAEEERNAKELRRQQEAYHAQVEERAKQELRRQGKVL
jgi:hypothetical protein